MKKQFFPLLLVLLLSVACSKSTLTLDRSELTLTDQGMYLTATVNPPQELVWTSSNEKIVQVWNGIVTPVSNGTAVVTVSTLDGKASASCTVTVSGHARDLSKDGAANCYIIPEPGRYRFKCVKGNSDVENVLKDVSGVKVLWESTFKSSVKAGDLVSSIAYEDDYVTIQTPGRAIRGNAVVAAYDASNIIIWSWHLWFCPHFVPENLQQTYNDGTVWMDRNLGASMDALSSSFGLMYQWGRKDPFPGPYNNNGDLVPTTGTFEKVEASADGSGQVSYTNKNPMSFITTSFDDSKWCYREGEENWTKLWQEATKTIYDPCPPGWKVPSSTWKAAANGASESTAGRIRNYGGTILDYVADLGADLAGMGIRQVTYPAAGYWDYKGDFGSVKEKVYVWSCTRSSTDPGSVLSLYVTTEKAQFQIYNKPNGARSVRCVKDN